MTLVDLEKFVNILQTQGNATVEFSFTKLEIFLAVAKTPGLFSSDYAHTTNTPSSSTDRHLRELREGKSGGARPKTGLGLIEGRVLGDDWRKNEIHLSRKGKLLLEQLLALGGRPDHQKQQQEGD